MTSKFYLKNLKNSKARTMTVGVCVCEWRRWSGVQYGIFSLSHMGFQGAVWHFKVMSYRALEYDISEQAVWHYYGMSYRRSDEVKTGKKKKTRYDIIEKCHTVFWSVLNKLQAVWLFWKKSYRTSKTVFFKKNRI